MLHHVSRWAYSALFLLLTLGWYLPRQTLRTPGYHRSLKQRLALSVPADMENCLWIHAVSLGEVNAIAPLLKTLVQRHPGLKILLSTTTETGALQVRKQFGARVHHVFCPWDFPWGMRRFLRAVRPRATVLVETELWPNLVHQCQRMNVPVLLLNARLSAASARGYGHIRRLSSAMLAELAAVAAQTKEDGERFCQLGLPRERLLVSGNLKFDIECPETTRERAAELRRLWGERPVWVAGSTHEKEETAVLDACSTLWQHFPELLLVLAPRHPERFAAVARQCAVQVPGFARRSSDQWGDENTRLLLVDTIGELPQLLAAADVAFIGGSLVPRGGHNVLEAAAWGVPVLCGPYLFNFQEAADLLEQCGALQLVRHTGELRTAMERWLEKPEQRRTAGAAGARQCAAKRGALEKQLSLLESFLHRD